MSYSQRRQVAWGRCSVTLTLGHFQNLKAGGLRIPLRQAWTGILAHSSACWGTLQSFLTPFGSRFFSGCNTLGHIHARSGTLRHTHAQSPPPHPRQHKELRATLGTFTVYAHDKDTGLGKHGSHAVRLTVYKGLGHHYRKNRSFAVRMRKLRGREMTSPLAPWPQGAFQSTDWKATLSCVKDLPPPSG